MTIYTFFSCLRILFIGLFLTVINIVNAQESCQLDYANFAPLSQNVPHAQVKIRAKTIQPLDVFKLTEQLASMMETNGIKILKSQPILSIDSALPRTNLLLAYDIFLLSQLYNQQQLELISIPPQLNYPANIQPYHVYQWMDATIQLWHCHWPKPVANQIKGSAAYIEVTPSEVYYLMTDILAHLMEMIKPELLRNFLTLRLLKVEFLLQDIMLKQGISLFQNNKIEQHNTSSHQLMLDGIDMLSAINGQRYLSKNQINTLEDPLTQLQFKLIASALLAGELLFFNTQNQQIEQPPMLPILNRNMSDEILKSKLISIDEMLSLLTQSVENNHVDTH